MEYRVDQATDTLGRTPALLDVLLRGLSDPWILENEGGKTWSPFDVVGHLIEGERFDWIPRARLILEHGEETPFEAFDRFSQLERTRGRSLTGLIDEFATLRADNLDALASFELTREDLAKTGVHPEFGVVTLRQHLSTWVVHDLAHVGQIVRTLAKHLSAEVGPWRRYLGILEG